MTERQSIEGHYSQGELATKIRRGLESLGKSPESGSVTVEDLAAVDEFHVGGRQASEHFLDQLRIERSDHLLDVGCGVGGVSRFVANRCGCHVTGVDLTETYIQAARVLTGWVGLEDLVTSNHASALEMPYEDASFDKAILMHVGMNIADKEQLFREIHRVLRPGARIGVYEIMRTGASDLTFPVPWATDASQSHVASPEQYRAALQATGFEVDLETDRREFALEFFARMRRAQQNAASPPALGLHLLMGPEATLKLGNLAANIGSGTLAPVEMFARRLANQ